MPDPDLEIVEEGGGGGGGWGGRVRGRVGIRGGRSPKIFPGPSGLSLV